jgi:hypothetical protein
MKDSFPPWVWHEVVRRTQLRVNVTDPDWATPVQDKDLDLKDPVTARWRAILKGWPREGTIWNEKHSKEYEIVATAVVCNQLAEHAQHLRGKQLTQGIPGAVEWYRERAAQSAAKGATGSDRAFFIRPTKAEDFVPGAGLFWAHFESKESKAKGNMAHEREGMQFLTEGKRVIVNNLEENGWKYSVFPNGDIIRTRGEGATAEKQWFAWQHEATVVDRDVGKVITFETSAGARIHTWTLRSLVDPMAEPWLRDKHEDTNVFVGFAPEGKVLPQLDKSLRDILPGRSAL